MERRSTPKNNIVNRRSTNKTPTGFPNTEQRPSQQMSALKNSKLAELGGAQKPSFFENKGKMSDLHKNAMHIKKLNVQGQQNVPFIGRHPYNSNVGSNMSMINQNYASAQNHEIEPLSKLPGNPNPPINLRNAKAGWSNSFNNP